MIEKYKLITERREGEYNHNLTLNGEKINQSIPRFLNTTIELVELNHIKYLSDSHEIQKFETRITIENKLK